MNNPKSVFVAIAGRPNAGKSTLENDSLIILSNTVRSWYWNEYLPNVTDCNEGKDDRINSEQCIKLKESLLQSPIIKVFRFFKSIYHNEYCNHTIHWELVEITKSIWFELNNSKRRVIINST